jgi:hypothetical protein
LPRRAQKTDARMIIGNGSKSTFENRPNLGQLGFDKSALYALAAPSTPDEARKA